MAITAERLEVEVSADTSSAKRELDSFSRSTTSAGSYASAAGAKGKGMGKNFAMAATMVKAAAGAMVAAMAGKTIMAASDLNEQLSKSGVVFGPQAKIVTDAADQMASKFGMNKAVFLEAASGIGLVGKASGLTAKGAANLGSDFAKLAADASSFYNVPVEEALLAMKSGLVGEAEPMRKFGVLLNETSVGAEAVRLGIAKVGDELTEGQKVQARASLMMKGMSDAQGDLARTQDSFANRLREVKGRLTNFAAEMGMKALPAAEAFMTGLIKAPKVIGNVVSSVKDYLSTNSTWAPIMDAAKAGVDALVTGIKALPGIFSTVSKAVQDFLDKHSWIKTVLDQAALAVGAFVAAFLAVMAIQKVMAVFAAIKMAILGINAAMMMNPVGLVIAGIVALAVVLYAAYQRFEGFRNVVNAVGSALKTGFVAALDWVKAKWAAWGPSIMAVLSQVKAGIAAFIGFMVPIWKRGFQTMWTIVKAVWNTIKGVIKGALSVIKGIINVVMGVIKGDWGRVWKGLGQIVSGVWGVIKSLVKGAISVLKAVISAGLSVIRAVWSAAWNGLKALVGKVWEGIKTGVSNGINAVMTFVRGLPGKIKGVFTGAGSWLLETGKAIIQGLLDGIENMIGTVKDKLGELTGMIPDWKGPYEKDLKLLRKNGQAIIKGLVKGFQQEFPRVKRYLTALTNWVRDGFGGAMEKKLIQAIKTSQSKVRKVLDREAKITDRLRAAIAKRAALADTKKAMVEAMSGGISAQANVLNAGNTAGAIKTSLAAQVTKVKEFIANLNAMRKAGFSKEVIAQVAGAGIEGGAEVAAALAKASSSEVSGINQSFAAINAMAKNESKALGNALYDSGIRAADGVIKGLKDRQKAIGDLLVNIAKSMENAIRKALGLKPRGGGKGDDLDRGRTAGQRVAAALSPGETMGGRPRGPGGRPGPGPEAMGNRRNGGGNHFTFKTYNPVAEPQSRTTNKALDRVANLGLV